MIICGDNKMLIVMCGSASNLLTSQTLTLLLAHHRIICRLLVCLELFDSLLLDSESSVGVIGRLCALARSIAVLAYLYLMLPSYFFNLLWFTTFVFPFGSI